MADAEESPSSLAELEALAGLDGTPASTDDGAAESDTDADDFDLASLAASTGLKVDDKDDDKLDLGALVAPITTAPVTTAPLAVTNAAQQSATVAEPATFAEAASVVEPASIAAKDVVPVALPASAPRGPAGFLYGLVAGIAVAAGMYFVMRETPRSQESTTPTVVATTPATAPTQPSPTHAATQSATPEAPTDIATQPAIQVAQPAPASNAESSRAPAIAATGTKPRKPIDADQSAANATPSGPRQAAVAGANDDPTRPPATSPAPTVAPSRPIDSLLDDALGSGRAKNKGTDNLMGEELPATPSAADVTKAIQLLLPAIRGCAMGESGVANTLLVVRSEGVVASAAISGAPFAGAASGRCMEGVLRRAKFPRFRQSVFRVQFPLSIRAEP